MASYHRILHVILPSILVATLVFSGQGFAQILVPPRVHWIGPEASCDYATIQAALSDVFNCGLTACPPGRNELRLSSTYVHSGQIVVTRDFDVRGGFDACEGIATSLRSQLEAPDGESLLKIAPANGATVNEFRQVTLAGGPTQIERGGVIEFESGQSLLTLRDSQVINGNARLGGGIYLAGDGNRLVINDTDLIDNLAVEGGAIFCTRSGEIDFISGNINDNQAQLSGGGIYLQANCHLDGRWPNKDRAIAGNQVSDIQRGQGAGIYSAFASIALGAVMSQTRIDLNIIPSFEQVGSGPLGPIFNHYRYGESGENRGGGVFLESSNATFYNTWFRANEAADGGALSIVGNSTVVVDRTSGTCPAQHPWICSLFEFNRARGGKFRNRDGDLDDEGGDGAAVHLESSPFGSPKVDINRSTTRFNLASCFEGDNSDLTGECDLRSVTVGGVSDTSIFYGFGGTLSLTGNLIYGNDIGDDNDCLGGGCLKIGTLTTRIRNLVGNTISGNFDMDLITLGFTNAVNNLIIDNSPDEFAFQNTADSVSCNLSNFSDEMNLIGNSINIASRDLDPLFVNPDFNSSTPEDFQIASVDSPAIDRCDDDDGLVTMSYDIVGNPRELDIPDVSNGPGRQDVGAFERLPDGFVNTTTDLQTQVTSAPPRQAALAAPHEFRINVINNGVNTISDFEINLDYDDVDGQLNSLAGLIVFDANGDPLEEWDCDPGMNRCTHLIPIAPGARSSDIRAVISHSTAGFKVFEAAAQVPSEPLTELTPADNIGSASVTVGAGADLDVRLVSAFPAEVLPGDPQLMFFHVRNLGPQPAERVRVHFRAAGGQVSFFGAPNWLCDNSSLQCERINPMSADDTIVDSFTAEVRFSNPGVQSLEAILMAAGGPGDPDTDNNNDSDQVQVLSPPSDALFADSFEIMQ